MELTELGRNSTDGKTDENLYTFTLRYDFLLESLDPYIIVLEVFMGKGGGGCFAVK